MVLDDGHIIESGSYDQLMSTDSTFRQLYERQLVTKEIDE
jgi:ABC-type multidrug transport system fused ATPase/permease subunit